MNQRCSSLNTLLRCFLDYSLYFSDRPCLRSLLRMISISSFETWRPWIFLLCRITAKMALPIVNSVLIAHWRRHTAMRVLMLLSNSCFSTSSLCIHKFNDQTGWEIIQKRYLLYSLEGKEEEEEERERRIRGECSHHRRIGQPVAFQIPFHVGLLAFLACREVSRILSLFQWMPWIECLNRNGRLASESWLFRFYVQHRPAWDIDFQQYRWVIQELKEFTFIRRTDRCRRTYSWSSPYANTSLSSVLLRQRLADVWLSWDLERSYSCRNEPDIPPCVVDKPVCSNHMLIEWGVLDLTAYLFGHSSRRASANSALYKRQTRCECVRKVVGRFDITFKWKLD